jgi:hypothetical protein
MELEDKAKIIEEFVRDFVSDELDYEDLDLDEFFSYNDLGVPIAQALTYDLVEQLSPEGQKVIEETWFNLCQLFGADPTDDYVDLDDVIIFGTEDDEDLE